MPSTKLPEEVHVLRFFETAPIEKAEAVFNIVCDRMRERAPNWQPLPRKQRLKRSDLATSRSGERETQDAAIRPSNDQNEE